MSALYYTHQYMWRERERPTWSLRKGERQKRNLFGLSPFLRLHIGLSVSLRRANTSPSRLGVTTRSRAQGQVLAHFWMSSLPYTVHFALCVLVGGGSLLGFWLGQWGDSGANSLGWNTKGKWIRELIREDGQDVGACWVRSRRVQHPGDPKYPACSSSSCPAT